MGELPFPATLGNHELSPAAQELEAHQNPADPVPFVLRVEALDRPRLRRQGVPNLAYELAGPLVEADHRSQWVVRLFVEIQDPLYPPHEGDTLSWRDHPLALEVWLEAVFLSVRLTVSWETVSTCPSSTIRSARSLMLQRSLPSGGSEHERAIKCASARPSKIRLLGLPGFFGISATSSPSSQKRLRSRAMVALETSKASAILSSVQLSLPLASALSRMRA